MCSVCSVHCAERLFLKGNVHVFGVQNGYCALGNGVFLVRNAAVHLKMGFENDCAFRRVCHFCRQQFFLEVNQKTKFSHRGAIFVLLALGATNTIGKPLLHFQM